MIETLTRLGLPVLHALDPETAHGLSIAALKAGAAPAPQADDPRLAVQALGLDFPNPVGLAAGFDKDAEVPDALIAWGFGFVEAGTITPRAQPGNPRPRLFRLAADRAVINRMGFNSKGAEDAARRLGARTRRGILGLNVGANKDSSDRAGDYETGVRRLGPFADYLTVNISSPNTPGLRGLQNRAELDDLLARVMAARDGAGLGIPVLVKIAPDLDDAALGDIVDVVRARNIAGLVISNTTLARPASLKSAHAGEAGGLSGAPLFAPSTDMLRKAARRADGALTLIGAGGIASGADAYAKIRAGASLVQLYTALAYRGPGLVRTIKRELIACLERDGFAQVTDAVGADFR